MSLIEEIRNSKKYNFRNIFYIEDLSEYVNVYDRCGANFMIWMCKNLVEEPKITKYINKYYKLIDFDRTDCKNRNFIMIIACL
jgi:hypothetical protein